MQETGVSLIHNVLQFTTIEEQTLKIISSKKNIIVCDTTRGHEEGRLTNIYQENLDTSKKKKKKA